MGVPFLKFPLLCGAGVAVLLAACGCNRSGGAGGGGTIATVGKDSISEQQFLAYLQRKGAFSVLVPPNRQTQVAQLKVVGAPGFQALKDLIDDAAMLQLAKEQNCMPTDKEVQDELTLQQKSNPQLVQAALSQGMSLDDLKGEIRNDLTKYKLMTKGVTKTTEDASKFVKDNPKNFMDPPIVQAQMVLVTAEKKADVDRELASGKPFITVAKEYTMDPTAGKPGNEGYEYNQRDETKMPPPVRALFDKTDELKTTDWFKVDQTGKVVAKFYVVKKVASKPSTVTPEGLERLRRALAQQDGAKAGNDPNKAIAQKLVQLNDQIKISNKIYQQAWTEFVGKLKDELQKKTTNAGSVISPPSAPPIKQPTPGTK